VGTQGSTLEPWEGQTGGSDDSGKEGERLRNLVKENPVKYFPHGDWKDLAYYSSEVFWGGVGKKDDARKDWLIHECGFSRQKKGSKRV